MQQKVADQQEALEIAMKLETAPVGDNSGIAQIQAQLAAMALELREMKKGKPNREEVLCMQCWTKGHDKERCPLVSKYLHTSAPNPFPPQVLYCELCRMTGQHRPENCYLLQRYGQGPKNPYCNFCKSVGHNEYEFCTYDAYRVHNDGPSNDSYGYQGVPPVEVLLEDVVACSEEAEASWCVTIITKLGIWIVTVRTPLRHVGTAAR